jgi:bacterioferritin-associated ferredoxin
VTFARLKEIADHCGYDFDQLADQTGCGRGCGLCVPYVRLTLRHGTTAWPVLGAAEFRALISAPPQAPAGQGSTAGA